MDKDLSKYKTIIEDALNYYRLPLSGKARGLALHKIIYKEAEKKFDYECISADPVYLSFLNLEQIEPGKIRYAEIFPENKETKFDWSAMLGHIATFQSLSKFYCFSEQTLKWYKFVAVSPEKDLALLIAEDITGEKEQEIAQNIARQNASKVE